MDNRETLTHQVAIQISRGICSPKWRRKNWIKGRGSGREHSCADQIDRVSDSEWPLRAAQFLKILCRRDGRRGYRWVSTPSTST
jgi:hypothetical protein